MQKARINTHACVYIIPNFDTHPSKLLNSSPLFLLLSRKSRFWKRKIPIGKFRVNTKPQLFSVVLFQFQSTHWFHRVRTYLCVSVSFRYASCVREILLVILSRKIHRISCKFGPEVSVLSLLFVLQRKSFLGVIAAVFIIKIPTFTHCH